MVHLDDLRVVVNDVVHLVGIVREVVQLVRQAIDRFIDAYNETAAPFEWTKRTITPGTLKETIA